MNKDQPKSRSEDHQENSEGNDLIPNLRKMSEESMSSVYDYDPLDDETGRDSNRRVSKHCLSPICDRISFGKGKEDGLDKA